MSTIRLSNILALIGCTWLLAASLSAQVATGRITGRVTDSSGAVVSGAAVTITNDATSVPQSVRSSPTGDYIFEAVNPGSYTLTAGAPGFKQFISKGIQAHIQDNLNVDVKLEVG
jgi:Carboxypeptidase regulatory-like domain